MLVRTFFYGTMSSMAPWEWAPESLSPALNVALHEVKSMFASCSHNIETNKETPPNPSNLSSRTSLRKHVQVNCVIFHLWNSTFKSDICDKISFFRINSVIGFPFRT